MENKKKKLITEIIKESSNNLSENSVNIESDEEKPGISYEIIGKPSKTR